MINKSYQIFLSELTKLINQDADLERFGELVMSSQYCKYLSKKVARKYHVENDDLHSEMVFAVITGNLLKSVISSDYNFNGHYFELRVSDIAKKLHVRNTTLIVDDIENQIIEVDDNVVSRVDERLQQITFNELKEMKLSELYVYQNQLINANKFNLHEFCTITELTIEELVLKTGISRDKLQRSRYKDYLVPIFAHYIELFKYWFDKRSTWISNVVAQFDSKHALYMNVNPNYSYSKFVKVCDHPSLWDLENLKLKLEVNNV